MTGLDSNQQFAALTILDYLSDLFTITARESFSRDEILSVLNNVRSDRDIIEPDVLVAYQQATDGIE